MLDMLEILQETSVMSYQALSTRRRNGCYPLQFCYRPHEAVTEPRKRSPQTITHPKVGRSSNVTLAAPCVRPKRSQPRLSPPPLLTPASPASLLMRFANNNNNNGGSHVLQMLVQNLQLLYHRGSPRGGREMITNQKCNPNPFFLLKHSQFFFNYY